MRRLPIILAFLLASSTGVAATQITPQITADPAHAIRTIYNNILTVEILVMLDYPSSMIDDGKKYKSVLSKAEINCTANEARIVRYALFSGNKASGDRIKIVSEPLPWSHIEKDSVSEALHTQNCNRNTISG